MQNKTYALLASILLMVFLAPSSSIAQNTSRKMGNRGQNQQNSPMKEFVQKQRAKGQEYQDQEEKEAQEFTQTMQGKKKDEFLQALKGFKANQYEKNTAFREKLFQEGKEFVNNLPQLSGEMGAKRKEKILARMEKDFSEMKPFFLKKHEENMAFIDKCTLDSKLEGPALYKALEEFMKAQKASAQEFMEKHRQEAQKNSQSPAQ